VTPPSALEAIVLRNWQSVNERIRLALARGKRPPKSCRLVAITKYGDHASINALYNSGARHMGEARWPDGWEHQLAVPKDVVWHFIGHIQRNKAKQIADAFPYIQAIDSVRLLETLADIGKLRARPVIGLLEVNIAREEQKYGLLAEEVEAALDRAEALRPHVQIRGFMCMAPLSEAPEASRPVFHAMHALRERLGGAARLPELSMGMSGDFEVAVEEGATLVRVGSALFDGVKA